MNMRKFSYIFFLALIGFSLNSYAGVTLIGEQIKDGNEVVINLRIQASPGKFLPLGASDFPIWIDQNVLDLQNAYLNPGQASAFDNIADPASYLPLSLHKNKLLVIRINENVSGNGTGVLADQNPKLIASIRLPILDPCQPSIISWETGWGQVLRYTNDPWSSSIKSLLTYTMVNPKLSLFKIPTVPSIANLDPNNFCQGASARLYTHNPGNFDVVWERDGIVVYSGTDTMYLASISGEYKVAFQNCSRKEYSDAINIQVTDPPTKPDITEDQGTLFSSSQTGNQWYLNGNILTGSTGSTIVPSQAGTYTVEVSNSCGSAVSDPYIYMVSSLGQGIVASKVGVYPNPYFGKTNIYLDLVKDSDVFVEVYDLRGIKVKVIEDNYLFSGAYNWKFGVGDLGLAAGSYVLKIFADGRVFTTTLIEASK
jgi:hypothetical protein